jgi:membrane dipeptidase
MPPGFAEVFALKFRTRKAECGIDPVRIPFFCVEAHLPIIVDAHEDIAWNTLCFGRDYLRSAYDIRRAEANSPVEAVNGVAMLGLPEWLRGGVAVIGATLFTPPERRRTSLIEQHYNDSNEAHALALRQMEIYERMVEESEQIKLIRTRADLESVLATWTDFDPAETDDPKRDQRQVGLVYLIEGGDSIREPAEVEWWYERGVRLIGPAWVGSRYCGGTDEPGPLTEEGVELLKHMCPFNLVLDLSHMDDRAFMQALDQYDGPVIASHSNPRVLTNNTNRHLSDEMIKALIQHDGVIGTLIFNKFLLNGWEHDHPREAATVETVASAIDYVCQIAGDARHAAIGTDFDGGFGMKSTPAGFDTVADLQIIAPALERRGYSAADVELIMNGNWVRVLKGVLAV